MPTPRKKKVISSSPRSSVRPAKVSPATTAGHTKPSVAELRANLGLSRALFARMIGASERSVASWESGPGPRSRAAQQAIAHAQRIYDTAARVMKASYIGTWLVTPLDIFGGLKPLEVIERGEHDRVWKELHMVETGTYI